MSAEAYQQMLPILLRNEAAMEAQRKGEVDEQGNPITPSLTPEQMQQLARALRTAKVNANRPGPLTEMIREPFFGEEPWREFAGPGYRELEPY